MRETNRQRSENATQDWRASKIAALRNNGIGTAIGGALSVWIFVGAKYYFPDEGRALGTSLLIELGMRLTLFAAALQWLVYRRRAQFVRNGTEFPARFLKRVSSRNKSKIARIKFAYTVDGVHYEKTAAVACGYADACEKDASMAVLCNPWAPKRMMVVDKIGLICGKCGCSNPLGAVNCRGCNAEFGNPVAGTVA